MPHTSAPSPAAGSTASRLARLGTRRAVGYLASSALFPGSVQLAVGNRRVGIVALRVLAVVWGLVALMGLLLLVDRGAAVGILAHGGFLKALQPVLVVLGLGWVLLLLDALRLARPVTMGPRRRATVVATSLVVAGAVLWTSIGAGSMVRAQGDLLSSVLGGGGSSTRHHGRYNILLLGGDAGADRQGLRPDSITVASVDATTGRTVLLSLPRNLEDVRFPPTSPLHALYPNGYSCDDHSCMLNAIYTLGQAHKDLYPGARDPGVQATKEAVEETLGLTVNYWAMIDLAGFTELIDALGGITLDINKRVPIGGGTSRVFGYIEPGRNVHLNGYKALWFARSRHGSTDYERMIRQKCVMNAMLQQLSPTTVLLKFNDVAAAGKEIAASDVPSGDVAMLMDLARKARSKPVSSVSFTPPLVYPGSPRFEVIRQAVKDAIARSEALDQGKPVPSSSATPGGGPSGDAVRSSGPTAAATSSRPSAARPTAPRAPASDDNGTPNPTNDDLGVVCRVP